MNLYDRHYGQLTNEEMRTRSSIGFFLFTPPGCNERLLTESGFTVREVRHVTEAVVAVRKGGGRLDRPELSTPEHGRGKATVAG